MPQLASFPLLSAFVVFLFMFVKYLKKSKVSKRKLPPGPPKFPLVGNLPQLIGPLPHHSITNLAKKYGPIMHLQLGEQFAVVISSPEAAKEVLKTNELNFAQRPEFLSVEIMSPDGSSLVFAPYGDYWRQVRKICVLELLGTKRVHSFRSIREEEVWDLIESIACNEGVPINLSSLIFCSTNDIVSRAVFGSKCKDLEEFTSLLGELVKAGGFISLADLYPSIRIFRYVTGVLPALERIKKKMRKILDTIVDDHKEKRKFTTSEMDLLDVLLKLQESNDTDMHLAPNQIRVLMMDIISAASETAATTIEWAMAELSKNPRVMEKAQAEVRQSCKGKIKLEESNIENLDYLKLIVKETLRLHPPGPLQPREAREKCEIGGYEIPARAKVFINAWAIGRDPDIWTEPDCFKPERFQGSSIDFKGTHFEYIPFGAGRRICPGISFATANIELALAQLLYHFDWKLPNRIKPEELDMSEMFGITSRKKHNLLLTATNSVPFSK